jgi:hypothetical protein
MKLNDQVYAPSALHPRKKTPGICWAAGRVIPRARLSAVDMKRIYVRYLERNLY